MSKCNESNHVLFLALYIIKFWGYLLEAFNFSCARCCSHHTSFLHVMQSTCCTCSALPLTAARRHKGLRLVWNWLKNQSPTCVDVTNYDGHDCPKYEMCRVAHLWSPAGFNVRLCLQISMASCTTSPTQMRTRPKWWSASPWSSTRSCRSTELTRYGTRTRAQRNVKTLGNVPLCPPRQKRGVDSNLKTLQHWFTYCIHTLHKPGHLQVLEKACVIQLFQELNVLVF